MSPLLKPRSSWTEEDLRALVDQKVEESLQIEYKATLQIDSPRDKQKACRHCSGFANGDGGTIVYGVREEEQEGRRVPVELTPLTAGDLKERLENVCLNGVTPRFSLRIHQIGSVMKPNGYYLVVYIPQSYEGVHMVTLGGENRYYKRRNFQTVLMTEEEVRSAYSRISQASTDAQKTWDSEREKAPPGHFAVSIGSVPLFSIPSLLDPMRFKPEELTGARLRYLTDEPLAICLERRPSAYEEKQYVDGEELHGLVRLGFSGVFQYVRVLEGRKLPAAFLVYMMHDCLAYFGHVYGVVGYYGPIALFYHVSSAKGTSLDCYRGSRNTFPIDQWSHSENVYVEELINAPLPVVKRFMDRLWIGYGFGGCPFFQTDGSLKGASGTRG